MPLSHRHSRTGVVYDDSVHAITAKGISAMVGIRDALEEHIAELKAKDNQTDALLAGFRANDDLIMALADCREQAGVSQRELARRMQTAHSVVWHLESGDTDPHISTIQRYAVALGCVIHYEISQAYGKISTTSHKAPGIFKHTQQRVYTISPSTVRENTLTSFPMTQKANPYAAPGNNLASSAESQLPGVTFQHDIKQGEAA